jgi:hypothetical protein
MSDIDRDTIKCVLMGLEDAQIRFLFVDSFSSQLECFTDHMVKAFSEWRKLDALMSKDLPGAHVSALVYGAFHMQVVAMKLFLCGLMVPAGNSQRYVLESLATALLVSKPNLGFLKRYMEGQYSTTKAVRDVRRHAGALQLERAALNTLESLTKFYDLSSHPTLFACASLITLNAENSMTVLGGCFDEGKTFAYEKEMSSRLSLTSILPNIVYSVRRNYLGEA